MAALFAVALPSFCADTELVNVARRELGSTAEASSVYGPGYEAGNVLDGRWQVRETDKWNSAKDVTPHWLRIDLGREWSIRKIVIRHEWKGAASSDFRVQRADSADGPWTDLVAPVVANSAEITMHEFAPAVTRHVRLFISKAEQGANTYGRIFEVEAYAEAEAVELPDLAQAEWMLRDAERGHFSEEVLRTAAAWLEHSDRFVRAVAEWILSRKVGQDNNSEAVVWPSPDPPEWFERWAAIPLAERLEMDWARQALSLDLHHRAESLAGSVDEMVARAERLVPLAAREKRARVRKQLGVLRRVRKRMDRGSADISELRRLWLEARRALRPIVFANSALGFDRILFLTRYALHYKPNVCGVHVSWAYKPGGDICVASGLESGCNVRPLINGQLGPGHVHGIDLWFDATRVAFGWANQDRWPPVKSTSWPRGDNECFAFELRNNTEPPHLYEIAMDGTGLDQVTDHDFWVGLGVSVSEQTADQWLIAWLRRDARLALSGFMPISGCRLAGVPAGRRPSVRNRPENTSSQAGMGLCKAS